MPWDLYSEAFSYIVNISLAYEGVFKIAGIVYTHIYIKYVDIAVRVSVFIRVYFSSLGNLDKINHHVVTSQECLGACYKEIGKRSCILSQADHNDVQQNADEVNSNTSNTQSSATIATDSYDQIEDDQVICQN